MRTIEVQPGAGGDMRRKGRRGELDASTLLTFRRGRTRSRVASLVWEAGKFDVHEGGLFQAPPDVVDGAENTRNPQMFSRKASTLCSFHRQSTHHRAGNARFALTPPSPAPPFLLHATHTPAAHPTCHPPPREGCHYQWPSATGG